jgi:hypothetical protein
MMYDLSATHSSMEHSPSPETNSSLAIAIFLTFYGNLSFFNVFTEPATSPYLDPDQSSPQPHILILRDQFNIVPLSTSRSAQ